MRARFQAVAMIASMTALCAGTARAQLNGENLLGDVGVKSGTQPAPGFYVSALYYRYATSTIQDAQGERVVIDPTGQGRQTIQAYCPVLTYVSGLMVLGGNLGMMAVLPLADGELEAPGFGLNERVTVGPGDVYLVPIQLGWHAERHDAIASFGLFAPTGRYSAGADDNLGKGMWTVEFAAGSTVYLDAARTWSLATSAYWEAHSDKEGAVAVGPVTLDEVHVGQLLTLEGGFGKSFLEGAAGVGLAYYAQWKLTADDLGLPVPGLPAIAKHRVWGFGPDVTVPIASRSSLIALLNVRYLWETEARVKTEGQTLTVMATFPLPSVAIKRRE